MILRLGRRLVAGAVGVFALLGFLAVPLGERTGFQHVRAIATGAEARRFYAELWQAAQRVRQRLWSELGSDPADAPASEPPGLYGVAGAELDGGAADASLAYPPGA